VSPLMVLGEGLVWQEYHKWEQVGQGTSNWGGMRSRGSRSGIMGSKSSMRNRVR